jgi:subtilisin family serine protease
MSKIRVLVEIANPQPDAFALHTAALFSEREAVNQAEQLVADLAGYGLEVQGDFAPVPMFDPATVQGQSADATLGRLVDQMQVTGFAAFASPTENSDLASATTVVACEVDTARLDALQGHQNLIVWPNSDLELFNNNVFTNGNQLFAADDPNVTWAGDPATAHPFDLALSNGGVDCRPFRPGVALEVIRQLLSVEAIWQEGFRGQNIVVGILDEGVNGQVYPVVGGLAAPNLRPPGAANITSHGSMCAADILVAAPAAKIYDYPFIGGKTSGTALMMFQAVLEQRRQNGTPHLTNNSYGFYNYPDQVVSPRHEVWDINHPLHRKIREVVASGAPAFFAAGNCGADCPSGWCAPVATGPGRSIVAASSLAEVITVAAVNSRHERIGYSSQGPGRFSAQKPDIAAYSHFFGNFGADRPAGKVQPYDSGTSAATPLAAGVAALLLSAMSNLTPDLLKQALINSAINLGKPGWDTDTGYGVVNAGAAYAWLKRQPPPSSSSLLEKLPIVEAVKKIVRKKREKNIGKKVAK